MKRSVVRSMKVATSFKEDEEDVDTSGDSHEEDEKPSDVESDALVNSSDEVDKSRKHTVAAAKPITAGSDSSRMMFREHKCLQAAVAMRKVCIVPFPYLISLFVAFLCS